MLGERDKALPILREGLEICRAHGDDIGMVQCLERIANIQRAMGRTYEALSTLEEAVTVATRSGDQLGLANALHAVGFTHLQRSDFVKAANALSEAITITRNVGWDGELSINLRSMGLLKMRLVEYSEAEELFQESISIARRIRSQYNLARVLRELGECFFQQSKPNEAASVLEESCLLFQELSQQGHLQRAATVLVELKKNQGDWNGALFWYDHIISSCRSQKEHGGVAYCLGQKGRILVNAQRYDEAALHFEAKMVISIENRYPWRSELGELCAVPKTPMKWEHRLLCDLKKLQRRRPQLKTAILKLPIAFKCGTT